jgi:hypothetical protein
VTFTLLYLKPPLHGPVGHALMDATMALSRLEPADTPAEELDVADIKSRGQLRAGGKSASKAVTSILFRFEAGQGDAVGREFPRRMNSGR